MTRVFETAAWPLPIDFSAVEQRWQREGFSFGVFRDPPGQQWHDFMHRSDEYVLVAERLVIRLRILGHAERLNQPRTAAEDAAVIQLGTG